MTPSEIRNARPSEDRTPTVLLPYQQAWCADQSPVKLCEKSRRIGLSWGEAADTALLAASAKGMDAWYIGYNKDMALEFIRDCAGWAKHYQLAAGEIEETEEVFVEGDDRQAVLAFVIRFASGFRITALSSRPSNLVYRNFRILATNRPPPPASDQGKQPLRSSGSGRATHRHDRTVARQHNRMQGRFMMSTQYNYAGIDIAKRNFVIAVSSLSKTKTETNNPKGIAHTIEYLKKHNVALVVMESTGSLEIPAAKAIHRSGIAVIIANPRQTHQFAQSQSLTKTDAKDAKMLAFFAQMTAQKEGWQTMLYQPPTEAEEVLEALVNRRNQLVDMRTAEKNRLHQVHETQVESVKQLIAHFDRLIDELDKQIDDHTHTHFDGKAQVAEQIKGIGSITAATLMAMLPELGRLSYKRLASLVGIAPHPRESGETKFKSRCFGGRSAVRKALYMAIVVATRFEPLIRDFYQRLLSKGKPYKVAVTACMRKLLTVLNARMRDYFVENGIRTA